MYVLDPEVLELIPRGVEFSIERSVFPRLAARGTLHGHLDYGYWRDIGTPESYLQAHFDLLDGVVTVPGLAGPAGDPGVMPQVAGGAPQATVAPGARVCRSILHEACVVGSEADVEGSILASGSRIGRAAVVTDAVLGERSRVADGVNLPPGTRLDPEATACGGIAGPPPELVGR